MVVVKDGLLRFDSELLSRSCELSDVGVVVRDTVADASSEQQLAEDVVEVLTIFHPDRTARVAAR